MTHVEVKPMPGLEHLPFAEVWFHEVDEARWREASAAARAIGKTGLEVWTTDKTPEVVAFLEERGYEQVRHYVISELDVTAAPDPDPPAFGLVTFAERPGPRARAVPDRARVVRRPAGTLGAANRELRVVAVLGARSASAGGVLHRARRTNACSATDSSTSTDDVWWNGFMAIARSDRRRGVAGAIKRGQIAWAKNKGIPSLRTANETRLEGLLAFNRRLGYRTLYTEIVLRGPAA